MKEKAGSQDQGALIVSRVRESFVSNFLYIGGKVVPSAFLMETQINDSSLGA